MCLELVSTCVLKGKCLKPNIQVLFHARSIILHDLIKNKFMRYHLHVFARTSVVSHCQVLVIIALTSPLVPS